MRPVLLLGEDGARSVWWGIQGNGATLEQLPGRRPGDADLERHDRIAAGMALRGPAAVVEIMFGDFVTLIADQLINHTPSSAGCTTNQGARPAWSIRTPMVAGAVWPDPQPDAGKIFLGVPGLRVLAPSAIGDPRWAARPGYPGG